MERTVTALVTCGEQDVGTVGPFPVAVPWWAEAGPVAERLEAELGGPVVVLRLVSVEGGESPRGGHVTYHAELLGDPRRAGRRTLNQFSPAVSAALRAAQDRRSAWATPHGVRDALAWADEALRAAGRPALGRFRQVKTWNLAGLFRIPARGGPVWLKTTPPFATDEAATMTALAATDPTLVPSVLAADPAAHRMLLDHAPGEDCWDAPPDVVRETITRFVAAQATTPHPPSVPHHPLKTLPDRLAPVIARSALTPHEQDQAHRLLDVLPGLLDELAACGLPETVVHGDFHSGNWRSTGENTVVLDFADAHIGHPALDGHRVGKAMSPTGRRTATKAWIDAWHDHAPGSDPSRALELADLYQNLFYAVRYQEFLDGIEPSEHVYHAGDPAAELREALRTAPRQVPRFGSGRTG
ncbi:aminoglycoside phosphotransferase family protein [Sphaerisporangium aureirubrum]|uniref:Aminoglycoside phosphotransferase family protein n=1 Tax=Sphaerisporangium aureirubrum TaxID=1544736 RepID=A0ABW1NKP0_9ACTN